MGNLTGLDERPTNISGVQASRHAPKLMPQDRADLLRDVRVLVQIAPLARHGVDRRHPDDLQNSKLLEDDGHWHELHEASNTAPLLYPEGLLPRQVLKRNEKLALAHRRLHG